ncbi:hypothetical protein HOF65_00095 [bacterium]|nr:hypothetical protein [bacterium]MBT3852450.1 hypothetical protein [bacterium]MBT4632798.1 hypothetical protein [bacterium]
MSFTLIFNVTFSLGLYVSLSELIVINDFLSVLSTTISEYHTLYSGTLSQFISIATTQI